MRFTFPKGVGVQCPTCGVPADDAELAPTEPGGPLLNLNPCGHNVTPAALDIGGEA